MQMLRLQPNSCLRKANGIAYNSLWYCIVLLDLRFACVLSLRHTNSFVHSSLFIFRRSMLGGGLCFSILLFFSSSLVSFLWRKTRVQWISKIHLYENHDIQSRWIHQNRTKYLMVLLLFHFWLLGLTTGKRVRAPAYIFFWVLLSLSMLCLNCASFFITSCTILPCIINLL